MININNKKNEIFFFINQILQEFDYYIINYYYLFDLILDLLNLFFYWNS